MMIDVLFHYLHIPVPNFLLRRIYLKRNSFSVIYFLQCTGKTSMGNHVKPYKCFMVNMVPIVASSDRKERKYNQNTITLLL